MKYSFVLQGETPSKKNSRRTLRNGKTIPSAHFMAWHDDSVFCLKRQLCPESPVNSPLFVKMTFYHGDYSRRDSDNEATSILDLLKDAGIIEDDNWKIIRRIYVENRYDKNNARCEIFLYDYTGKD